MALKEEFEKSGNWLFKRRSWLPVAMVPVVLFAWTGYSGINLMHKLGTYWTIICLAVSISGLAVRIYTVGHSAPATSGRNRSKQVAGSLNSTGIYAAVRHPLYLGNFLMFLGVTMFPGVWWLCIILCLVFFLYYERIMFAEEEFLRSKFGNAYTEWASKTPAFIPRISSIVKPEYGFSLRKVLRHEHTSVLSMGISFAILDFAHNIIVLNQPFLSRFIAILLCVCATAYLILRILAKKTPLLDCRT
jgi:protein-S-isoprenylcysteine O-methyltransferase Ste14